MTPPLIDPRLYVIDPAIKPLRLHVRADLTAPDIPTLATGQFIICDRKPPRGQAYIFKSMSFYAMARVNVGAANESFAMLDPQRANGFFNFEPLVGGNSPYIIELDVNTPRIMGSGVNSDRTQTKGTTFLSSDPDRDCLIQWYNPMHTIYVPGDVSFSVIFSLLRNAPAGSGPIPAAGQFYIGNPAAGSNRVDFAGVVFMGMAVSEQSYRDVVDFLSSEASVQAARRI